MSNCGRLTYGIFHKRYMRFMAVSLDPDDIRIYTLCVYSNKFGKVPRFHCVLCRCMISDKNGTMEHRRRGSKKKCKGNLLKDARKSVRQWAAFRANEEAKEDGLATGTFTLADWQRWMQRAGCKQNHLSDEEWSRLMKFVQTLEALPADHLQNFKECVRNGESHVRFINDLRSGRKCPEKRKTQETTVIDNDTELPPVKIATLDTGTYEHQVSDCSYIFGNSKLPLTKWQEMNTISCKNEKKKLFSLFHFRLRFD